MIFSELYSAYYNAVAAILKAACETPVSRKTLREIVERETFRESLLNIEPAILNEDWQLLNGDGSTPLRHVPTIPLTLLQRRWLKAIAQDPRIRLFPETFDDDPEVEPLFHPEDIDVFDRYNDGDPYEDEDYIRHFRTVLEAIRDHAPLDIVSISAKGKEIHHSVTPESLEYSEKDDKFRISGFGFRHTFINLSSVVHCSRSSSKILYTEETTEPVEKRIVELEVTDQRNALERVFMHFAHFEKQAERLDRDRYRISIVYQKEDETEMLIRILAFGPRVRVVAPETFVERVKERLQRQKSLNLSFLGLGGGH